MNDQEFDYKESTINFLIYNYFGITLDCGREDLVLAAIMKAYDDATMQGAYTALFKKSISGVEELEEKSDIAIRKSAKLLKERLELLFACKVEYDIWHYGLCHDIEKNFEDVKYKNKKFFTYGNAQKWVNMTIKYICMFDALCEKSEFHQAVNHYYKQFHIPVDSYMIEALWGERDVFFPNAKRDKKYKDYNVMGWSCWEENDYLKFKKSLNSNSEFTSGKSPLDWENKKWIEQSNIRKDRKGKSFDKRKIEFSDNPADR